MQEFKDMQNLNIGKHSHRLDYLYLAALYQDEVKFDKGIERIDDLARKLKRAIGSEPDIMVTSNLLAKFLNQFELYETKGDFLERMAEKGKNTANSLEISLLHNILASKAGLDNFNMLCENNYYAPNLKEAAFSYSIFLRNTENLGKLHHFTNNVREITTREALVRFIRKQAADDKANSAYLDSLANEIVKYNDYDQLSVGEQYRRRREMLGLSQRQVAECIGKASQTYGDYENSKTRPDSLLDKKIREVLGLEENFFFTGKQYKAARQQLGMSLREVGEKLGKAKSSVGDYEIERVIPDIYTAKKLKHTLKL